MATWGHPWGHLWGLSAPDYQAEALARVTEYYKVATNLKALIAADAARWEHIAHVAELVGGAFSLESAEGVQLDVAGRVLNLPRGTDTDARYRLRLQTRALHVLPEGRNRLATIIAIVRKLTDENRQIAYLESYPRGFVIEVDNLTAEEEQDLLDFLPLTRPATYNALLVSTDDVFGFVYEDDTGGATVTGLGYGDSTDAATGGTYADATEID